MTETINGWTLKPNSTPRWPSNPRRPETWLREDGTKAFVIGSRLIWYIAVEYDGFRMHPDQKHIYTRSTECNQVLREKLADPNFLSNVLEEGAAEREAEANALLLAAKTKQESARTLGTAAIQERP